MPEAVAIEDYQDATNEKAKRWIKEVAGLRSKVLNTRGKPEEAYLALAAIDDPLAATAIAKELNSNQPRKLRSLYVQLLGKFHNAPAVYSIDFGRVKR